MAKEYKQMEFNDTKLRMLMAEHNMTNVDLSNKIKVSPDYVSLFRRGEKTPTIKNVNKMIKFFKITDWTELWK